MKTTNRKSIALALGLLTVGGTLGIAQPSEAAPRDYRQGFRDGRRIDNRNNNWRNNNRRNNSFGSTWTGRVTRVRAWNSFDIRVGNSTYNVYANNRTPRRLSVGDLVSVRGQRRDSNDIRNATVSIVRNR